MYATKPTLRARRPLDPLDEADRVVREAFEEDLRHEAREAIGEWRKAAATDDVAEGFDDE